jgi:branched-chain amino acid transport system ATP-binding protein
MSGGQQQMLAIGRAIMGQPKLLMLDEPSLGLAPMIVENIFDTIKRLNDEGVTIFLVEQNARQALELAHRAYILEQGRIVGTGTGQELLHDNQVQHAYLGFAPNGGDHV